MLVFAFKEMVSRSLAGLGVIFADNISLGNISSVLVVTPSVISIN